MLAHPSAASDHGALPAPKGSASSRSVANAGSASAMITRPRTLAETLAYSPALGLLVAILGTLPVALYATAFDRGLSAQSVSA